MPIDKKSAKSGSAAGGKRSDKKKKRRWLVIFITIFFILLILAVSWFFCQKFYSDKILPKTMIGDLKIGSLNYQEAEELVTAQFKTMNKEGITYLYQDEVVAVAPQVVSTADPDLNYEIFSYDLDATFFNINLYGHGANFLANWQDLLVSLFRGKKLSPSFTLDKEQLIDTLKLNFSQYEKPAVEAQLTWVGDEPGVVPEKSGEAFDYDQLAQAASDNLSRFSTASINLQLQPDEPVIEAQFCDKALKLARQIINLAPININYQDKKWAVDKEELKKWLTFKLDPKNNWPTIGFNGGLSNYLAELSKEVNVEVKEGKFKLEGSKVAEFQPSQIGQELQITETIDLIAKDIIQGQGQQTTLVVNEVLPQVATEQINTYGIKELIGSGVSNFKGSPKNRRHNIAVGADTLNGILIKPGEEFSLVKALGKIEASTGYLPELVIKGNKTVPEYGGGLCQIGTTTFRVALASGLPITERSPHSYRVSYYEPAGTDATIYDPKPDLKFINDTGHYILFITKIDGDSLTFEFYGTSDGRKVEMTEPRLYNFVKPPATKIVETEDLPVGEKKCTEKAHTGADAEFTRTITQASGEVKEESWTSHYKPWQEVCLLGVAKGTLNPPIEPEEETEETTNANLNTNQAVNQNTNLNINQELNQNINAP